VLIHFEGRAVGAAAISSEEGLWAGALVCFKKFRMALDKPRPNPPLDFLL
jgi:hypothetical protein